MLPAWLVVAASFAYLALLYAVARYGDLRARQGRSVVSNAWVYALSMAVYCTAWTYFGSVGRAAASGLGFLPIYLGPTLAMLVAWIVVRKMIRIARTHRITSIADFIASRHGKSRSLAALVTLIAVVGILPYVALQLKAIAGGYALLTASPADSALVPWWRDSTFAIALALAAFTVAVGTRHLDTTERHEGMVAAIAFESVVKLVAFVAVGVFVTWGLFDGPGDLFARADAVPALRALTRLGADGHVAATPWFTLILLSMLSVLFLPRQFQVMVVENVAEQHVRRAAWVFPLYLLAINLFVLPIALGGLLSPAAASADAETFVLSLPLAHGEPALALFAFIGGLSAATGMIIVEAIAVSTMVCNDLVVPLLLRRAVAVAEFGRLVLQIRRGVIVALLLLGYLYFRVAGEAYALVSIGLISFAAVAQFAPALLGGMFWRGGTSAGALAGLGAGFALWAYTLMLPSIARSGWMPAGFVTDGPFGIALLRPEQLFGLGGLDNLSHAMWWSLLANVGLYVGVSLARTPSARETGQATLFVDAFEQTEGGSTVPLFWRGRAKVADLLRLAGRFLGAEAARQLAEERARRIGPARAGREEADAAWVQFVETQLAGAIGSASARAMVASVVDEEPLGREEVLRILEEAQRLRTAHEQLQSLDRLKDDFMSSVTHELRTPLTSIRAFAELMRDDPQMDPAQRARFLELIVAETERLTRLVNQVLDMAKIESGHAQWNDAPVELPALLEQAVATTRQLFDDRAARVVLRLPAGAVPVVRADADRLTQVVLNLLSNAAKFVPRETGQVEVALHRRDAGVTVTVSDNGPGIPADQQELVFEKFRQGGDGVNRPQGTGLGLPISRQIIEHFGGRLWLKSEPGRGACFGFDLPLHHEETAP